MCEALPIVYGNLFLIWDALHNAWSVISPGGPAVEAQWQKLKCCAAEHKDVGSVPPATVVTFQIEVKNGCGLGQLTLDLQTESLVCV